MVLGVTDFLHGNSLVVWWRRSWMGGDGASQCPLGEHCCEQDREASVGGGVHGCACAVSGRQVRRCEGQGWRAGAVVCLGSKGPFVL